MSKSNHRQRRQNAGGEAAPEQEPSLLTKIVGNGIVLLALVVVLVGAVALFCSFGGWAWDATERVRNFFFDDPESRVWQAPAAAATPSAVPAATPSAAPAPRPRTYPQTPPSFCGVAFGEAITAHFPSAAFVDNSNDRKNSFGLSFVEAPLSLDKPFRHFRTGHVRASMTGGKIYEVELVHDFPRDVSKTVDEAEHQAVLDVLAAKYGVPPVQTKEPFGDVSSVFKVRDVHITLHFTREGVVDRGQLKLTARNVPLFREAEKESRAHYQKKADRDLRNRESFQNGGIDAL